MALCNKSVGARPFSSRRVSTARPARLNTVVCRATTADVDRRAVLGAIAASVPALMTASPALAAYGDAANVFGKVTNKSGFVPYAGEGFSVLLPAKWGPSRERDFPNIVLRYEDNFDIITNMFVIVEKSDKSSVDAYGDAEKFLERVSYLLGKQAYDGETISEGGFAPNRVSAASLLDVKQGKDSKGKTFYAYEILTRTADGDEGGRHQLIKATISNGNLYILKVQAGDKRWFKGAKKDCQGVLDSFTVA